MNVGQCKLCIKDEAEFIANKIATKEITHQQAARELEVPLETWISHYELHVRKRLLTAIAQDVEPLKNNLLDKIKEGTDSVKRVINLTKKIEKLLQNEDNQQNTKLISAYATLEKNLITGLKEMAILEGDITQATTINIQQNVLKVDKIMAIVMEDAPPEVQQKILKKLETLDIQNAN